MLEELCVFVGGEGGVREEGGTVGCARLAGQEGQDILVRWDSTAKKISRKKRSSSDTKKDLFQNERTVSLATNVERLLFSTFRVRVHHIS